MARLESQVQKSCDCCKTYVGHLEGKMKCFQRHMTADFRHGMIIPNKFMDHFGGKISRTIELESPDGNTYVVEVSKNLSKKSPCHGWEAFLDAHHIEENDSLLFRHIKNSRFEVLVLDSDDCEKVFSCVGIKVTCNVQERSSDYDDISNSSYADTTKSSGSKEFASCERVHSSHPRKTAKTPAKYSSSEDSGEDTEDICSEYESSFQLDDLQTPLGCDYVLCHRSAQPGVHEEKVTRLLQDKDIRAEAPLLVAIIRQSNLKSRSSGLVIPKGYAAEHLPHKSQTVILQRPGKNKKWYHRFHIRKDGCAFLRLLGFLRDNQVQEGDICVFEPMKGTGKKFSLKVHLLRESIHGGSGTGPKRVSSPHGKSRVSSATHIRISTTHGRTRANATPKTRVKEELDHGRSHPYSGSNHGHRAHKQPLESDEYEEPVERPYMLSDIACLTWEQEKKVKRRVDAIQSEVPIYVSIMNNSSVGANRLYHLTIPKKYAAKYLPAGGHTLRLLRPERSKTWDVEMHPRVGGAKMLRGGWHEFANENRLQVQDLCLFQLMKNERRLTMMVYIIRHNDKR
ncbi:B3 domain-containing protein Os03g0620400 [Brachypodium distachyon]|uniref:B3 domain-containing protein Os03g0620400 n=1 Tax=Brachypodium distachyon TaxID=15368 RepID=UPI00052FE05D|nr:B3 domain-containing protein Os03g0620400 [Brachypodium distachyon]|eukprot:XP_010232555.1 B3 domain-containing protein Os03g0620400 [Brachypodium distachyon]